MEVYLSGKRNIYEEIVETYAKYIRTGALRAGEKLPSCRGLAMQLGINPNTVERAYSELEKRGLIRTLPKKGAFVRGEAAEKPPDTPDAEAGPPGGGTESGEAGGIHAEGPPQAERAGGGMARDPAGGTAASPKQGPAAMQGALAGDRQEPAARQGALAGNRQDPAAAMQGALAGAERQEALADAERQEALLRAKEALLRLRQAGVSAAEAHALIKQLFGEAEKGEKR